MRYAPTNTTCTGVSHSTGVSHTPSCQKTFPLPSLSHARPNHPPVSRRTIQSLRPYLFPAPRTPELHHPPMMDSRPQSGYRHATANAVVFTNAPDKETVSNSNCTIPFGHPPEPETTRFSETNFHNEKARQRPAKQNLRPARAGENGTSDSQEQGKTEPRTRKGRGKRKPRDSQGLVLNCSMSSCACRFRTQEGTTVDNGVSDLETRITDFFLPTAVIAH